MEDVTYLVQVVVSNSADIGMYERGWTEEHRLFRDIKFAKEYAEYLRRDREVNRNDALLYEVEVKELILPRINCGIQSIRFDQ